MTLRPAIAALALLGLVVTGCSGDSGSRTPSEASSAADPADDAATEEPAPAESDAADPDDAADPPDLPDMPSGGQCEADISVSGAVNGTLEGGTFASIDAGEGPQAFYQAMGEDLMLSAYSEGNGIEPNLVLQAGSETYGTDPGASGMEIAADGSGLTLDTEVVLLGSGDKAAQVTGTMTC